MSMLWQRFTERAKRVVIAAQEEAAHAGEPYVSPEHLLLGLVKENDSVATKVLERLGVAASRVRQEVERQIGARGYGRLNNNDVTLDPRMKRVLDFAYDEARQSNTNYIGTEHLLLGIIREGDGIAFRTLAKLGVDIISARKEVVAYLGGEQPQPAKRQAKTLVLDEYGRDLTQMANVLSPTDQICRTGLLEHINAALNTLPDRERKVIELRYGLEDGQARTLEEVGRVLKLTRERVRQIEEKALDQLRQPGLNKGLGEYVEA